VIVTGPFGEIAEFRFPGRIELKTAYRGGAAHHVEADADCVVDIGDLLACKRVEPFVSPRAHPVDQLRGDKLLFEKQSKDMGLKDLPQGGDVDIRRGKELAVTSECAGRGEDVQVRMPV
jgi:hypothetical protein